jgi:hypothetical protein
MTQRRVLTTALVVVGLMFLSGCGGDSVKMTPAAGVVKLDGKPAAGIMVQFMPNSLQGSKGPTSFGVTDDSGKFVLKTHDGREGAVVGQHMVTLFDSQEERPAQGQVAKTKPRLASRYSVGGPNALTAEVKEGGEAITIEAGAR